MSSAPDTTLNIRSVFPKLQVMVLLPPTKRIYTFLCIKMAPLPWRGKGTGVIGLLNLTMQRFPMAYRLGDTDRTVWNRCILRPQMKNNPIRIRNVIHNVFHRFLIGGVMHGNTTGFNLFLVVMPVLLVRPFGNRRSEPVSWKPCIRSRSSEHWARWTRKEYIE